KALVEIRNRVADLAVLTAGQLIRKDLDDSTHRQLAQEIIEGIGRN
ncbi:MAG: F0F1 ATP synthase subunit B, partial [Armatimonadetes bacterium]|nr:F0F1 ATP synthase subunit B [Armatimonadota bacterium]